ncbi:hypothetical protein LOC68_08850 [Blastopirellula sp. JC732]|uniref:Uncharacterized protein n=1 Tax=Blastopirellula sediminis TaxID=2894196 RepID=A0A9X1MLG3_9BACT|nr:hypothetical protein [Blastopirellula sediminis]MCC9608721.1 hypothetical protein [Blastopirellula sediminis]MCC9628502.1 hypothetical protein [Blastopirellula sediminis]
MEYLGLSEEEVENRLIAILKDEGFDEVAGWDPTLSPIAAEPPSRGGGEKEVFVLPDRYFEKEIAGGKIGCALGVDLDYFNKGACQCRTRSYLSGRVAYWRWAPLDKRIEPANEVGQIGRVIFAHHLIALKETSEFLLGDKTNEKKL